jgi:1,2-diacylglycerol 3-alpha-glucosyltransferase
LIGLKFDVIHVQEVFSIGVLGHAVAKRTGVPLVYTVHTQWDKLFKHYPKSVIAALIGVGASFPLYFGIRSTLPVYLLENGDEPNIISKQFGRNLVIFANECDAVIAPSVHVLDKLKKFNCKSRLEHIPNSIDLSPTVQSIELPAVDRKSAKFVCVGRVSLEKRTNVLVEVFSRLPKSINAELFIIGDGPALDECMAIEGSQNNVHFMGHLDNKLVRQLISDADMLVLASHGFDNQPMVILEALAAGVGVLYCDPQIKDGLDNMNSLLVHHSAAGLRSGIIRLTHDSTLVKKLAKGSKQKAKYFSASTISTKIEKLYEDLITKNKQKTI